MKKKETPLIILNQMNEFKKGFPHLSKIVKADSCLIRYEDKDPESEFFFQINSFNKSTSGEFMYSISYKPTSENVTEARNRTLNFAGVGNSLNAWGEILKKYENTDFFLDDDPIIASYTEEFFNEYKIVEEDANYKPFNLKSQLLINAYLIKSIQYIENIKDESTKLELNKAKEIAKNLNEHITELTKNEVMLKLSKFWAETRKKGLPIFKEIFMELAKEVLKEIGKKMIGL
jgi:hypothetical protein